jgi:hypothetical protein
MKNCETWSCDYNDMLVERETVRSILGLPATGSFRLDVSDDIDHGKSWMLPVLAAQAAFARGSSIVGVMAKARALIWTTGAVDLSAAETLASAVVAGEEYHLKIKVERSRSLFAEAAHAGVPVICLVPQAPGAEDAAGWLAAVLKKQAHHIRIVGTLQDTVQVIERFMLRGSMDDLEAPSAAGPEIGASPRSSLVEVPAGRSADGAHGRGGEASPSDKVRPEDTSQPGGAGDGSAAEALSPTSGEATAGSDHARRADTVNAGAGQGDAGKGHAVLMPAASQRRRMLPLSGRAMLLAGAGMLLITAGLAAVLGLRDTQRQPTLPVDDPVAQPSQAKNEPKLAAPAVVRIGVLRAGSGQTCRALAMDMQPLYAETQQLLAEGTVELAVENGALCGLTAAGLDSVTARFVTPPGNSVVPSLSSASRLILNPGSPLLATSVLRVEVKQTAPGQVTVFLR